MQVWEHCRTGSREQCGCRGAKAGRTAGQGEATGALPIAARPLREAWACGAPGRVSCGPGHFRKHWAWVDRGQADGVVLRRGEGLVERLLEGLAPEPGMGTNPGPSRQEFSHPVESLALTVEEVMDVRRVLVKAEMEKFLQDKELFSSLKKGKVRHPQPALRGRESGCGRGWAWRGADKTGLEQGLSYRSAAAAEPSSHCSPGRRPVSFARGEPSANSLAVN